MECALSAKNCTRCWRWSCPSVIACSTVNSVRARSSPCWTCWMSWCQLPLWRCKGSFRCSRSRSVWLCLRRCCLLADLMWSRTKQTSKWDPGPSRCWRGRGCVDPCWVPPLLTCCKALTQPGKLLRRRFCPPGIKPYGLVVPSKIGRALSDLIWPFIAPCRRTSWRCWLFGITIAKLHEDLIRVCLVYNERTLLDLKHIGCQLWAIFPLLPNRSQVSHGFEPCLNELIETED